MERETNLNGLPTKAMIVKQLPMKDMIVEQLPPPQKNDKNVERLLYLCGFAYLSPNKIEATH